MRQVIKMGPHLPHSDKLCQKSMSVEVRNVVKLLTSVMDQ